MVCPPELFPKTVTFQKPGSKGLIFMMEPGCVIWLVSRPVTAFLALTLNDATDESPKMPYDVTAPEMAPPLAALICSALGRRMVMEPIWLGLSAWKISHEEMTAQTASAAAKVRANPSAADILFLVFMLMTNLLFAALIGRFLLQPKARFRFRRRLTHLPSLPERIAGGRCRGFRPRPRRRPC